MNWRKIRMSVAATCLVVGFAMSGTASKTFSLPTRSTPNGVEVNVSTGGCTERISFIIKSVVKNKEASVIIHRRERDACKGFFPDGTWIAFSWQELGLTPGTSITVFVEDED
jgi:hypothetical protein